MLIKSGIAYVTMHFIEHNDKENQKVFDKKLKSICAFSSICS